MASAGAGRPLSSGTLGPREDLPKDELLEGFGKSQCLQAALNIQKNTVYQVCICVLSVHLCARCACACVQMYEEMICVGPALGTSQNP